MNKKNLIRTLISIVGGILVLFLAFGISSRLGSMKEAPKRKSFEKSIPEVEIMRVKNGPVANLLEVQGTLVAFDKIDIFAEVSGVLEGTARPFKEGAFFSKGDTLIRIDDEEARLAILSQKSTLLNGITQMMPDLKVDYRDSYAQWQSYLEGFDLERPIQDLPAPVSNQEKFFVASRNLYSQLYSIRSAEARLEKYVVQAPFSGILTSAAINPGALVRAGQKLGELMHTGQYELEVTVPLADTRYLQPGSSVQLFSEDVEGAWSGAVKRIGSQIDPGSQTVKVFIGVQGTGLREGMYLRGEVKGKPFEQVVSIPRALLINQKNVYVVRDTLVELVPVDLKKLTQDQAIIGGLEDGMPLLKELAPGIFNGMRVNVKDPLPAQSLGSNQ